MKRLPNRISKLVIQSSTRIFNRFFFKKDLRGSQKSAPLITQRNVMI